MCMYIKSHKKVSHEFRFDILCMLSFAEPNLLPGTCKNTNARGWGLPLHPHNLGGGTHVFNVSFLSNEFSKENKLMKDQRHRPIKGSVLHKFRFINVVFFVKDRGNF